MPAPSDSNQKGRKLRKELQEKEQQRKAKHIEESRLFNEHAKEGIVQQQKEELKSTRQKSAYKTRVKKEREEYETMRKKKDSDEAKLVSIREEQAKKRKQQLEYLQQMSTANRRKIAEEKREQEQEMKRQERRYSADRDARNVKTEAVNRETREKRSVEDKARIERGRADINEQEEISEVREQARKKQSKLTTEQQNAERTLKDLINQKRAIVDAQPEFIRMDAVRQLETMENSERKKIEDKYMRLRHQVEVEANTKILEISKVAKERRDQATQNERRQLERLHDETIQTRTKADRDAAQKKREAAAEEQRRLEE